MGLLIDNCTQWQDVLKQALEAAIILTIMGRLDLFSSTQWLECHLDQFSVQACLCCPQPCCLRPAEAEAALQSHPLPLAASASAAANATEAEAKTRRQRCAAVRPARCAVVDGKG